MGWESSDVVRLVLEVWGGKPSHEIMGWESSGVVGFDLGPLLQGQTRIAKLKSAYNSFIIGSRGWDGKLTYRKSWAGNILM